MDEFGCILAEIFQYGPLHTFFVIKLQCEFYKEKLTQSTSQHLSALKAKFIYNAELISKNTKWSYTTLSFVSICCRPWGIILIDFQEKSRSVLLTERKRKCFEVRNWGLLTGNFQLFSFSGALTIDRYKDDIPLRLWISFYPLHQRPAHFLGISQEAHRLIMISEFLFSV